MKNQDFFNLHLHTEYSSLDGIIRIPELVRKIKDVGQEGFAVTDHGTMAALPEAYDVTKKEGVRLIPGMEAYTIPDYDEEKRRKENKEERIRESHLVLIARNEEGYRNLLKLHFEGYKNKRVSGFARVVPRLDHKILEKYSKGIIASTACILGEIPTLLLQKRNKEAEELAKYYNQIFDHFYLEVMPTFKIDQDGEEIQATVNRELIRLANKLDIPLIVTTDSHYLNAEDEETHRLVLAMQSKKAIDDEDAFFFRSNPLLTTDELLKEFDEKIIKETSKVADICGDTGYLDPGTSYKIPYFPIEEESGFEKWRQKDKVKQKYGDEDEQTLYFRYQVQQGWNKKIKPRIKNKEKLKKYLIRLKEEMKVIIDMQFPSYFLIVADLMNWCDEQKIRRGIARGSAGGSLVSYILNITKIDPIKYNLLFSRFLNKDRVSMPDIDMDIDRDRREETKEYLRKKYGYDKVASIGTFSTMKVRACIKDIVRSLNLGGDKSQSFLLADKLSKAVPPENDITYQQALDESEDFRALLYYPTEEEYERQNWQKKIKDGHFPSKYWQVGMYLRKIENMIRQTGTHAAGVIISTESLDRIMPMAIDKNDVVVTAYDMHSIESAGFLKLDLLGLKTLTIVDKTIENIKRLRSEDVNGFPLRGVELIKGETEREFEERLKSEKESVQKASRAYQLLRTGKSKAVFQLESQGMADLLKNIQANSVEDISDVLALHRPGPLESGLTVEYGDRKFGRKPTEYLHSSLEPILKDTQAILVYQEQVIQIAVRCAGFTESDGDTLRKCVGKKIKEKMILYEEKFVEGCQKVSGMSKEVAEKLWQQIVYFSGYGFNRSHSMGYGMTAYQTAYLKANYPAEFWGAVLSHEDDQEQIDLFISEIKANGIELLPADVNRSGLGFNVETTQSIRRGLGALKHVGEKAIQEILSKRPYKSMIDFLLRVESRKVNSKTIKMLIQAGAFDTLEEDVSRKTYFEKFEECRKQLKKIQDKEWKEVLKELGYKLKDLKEFTEEQFKELLNKEEIKKYGDVSFIKESDNVIKDKITALKGLIGSTVQFDYVWNDEESSEWNLEEMLDLEAEVYGSPVSGHIFDLYKEEENQVQQRFGKTGELLLTSDSLDKFPADTQVIMMVRVIGVSRKFSYKKDSTQFLRLIRIEDRFGKMEIGVFEKNYGDKIIDDSGHRIKVWKPNNVIIIRAMVDLYKGRKGLKYKNCLKILER